MSFHSQWNSKIPIKRDDDSLQYSDDDLTVKHQNSRKDAKTALPWSFQQRSEPSSRHHQVQFESRCITSNANMQVDDACYKHLQTLKVNRQVAAQMTQSSVSTKSLVMNAAWDHLLSTLPPYSRGTDMYHETVPQGNDTMQPHPADAASPCNELLNMWGRPLEMLPLTSDQSPNVIPNKTIDALDTCPSKRSSPEFKAANVVTRKNVQELPDNSKQGPVGTPSKTDSSGKVKNAWDTPLKHLKQSAPNQDGVARKHLQESPSGSTQQVNVGTPTKTNAALKATPLKHTKSRTKAPVGTPIKTESSGTPNARTSPLKHLQSKPTTSSSSKKRSRPKQPTEQAGGRKPDPPSIEFPVHEKASNVDSKVATVDSRVTDKPSSPNNSMTPAGFSPSATQAYPTNTIPSQPERILPPGPVIVPVATNKNFPPSRMCILPRREVAMSCAMVDVGKETKLARVSMVDWKGAMLLDLHIVPTEYFVDAQPFPSRVISFQECRSRVQRFLVNEKPILVGHGVTANLNVLRLTHPWYLTRDSANFLPFTNAGHHCLKMSVREMASRELGISVAEHVLVDSVVGAQLSMSLYQHYKAQWNHYIQYQQNQANDTPTVRALLSLGNEHKSK